MAAIPGWVYVIMGIIMILASQLIKDADGTKSLTIFLYVGILFLVIGIGKYIFGRGKKSKSAKDTLKPIHINTEQQKHQHTSPQHQHAYSQHSNIINCPACGTRHHSYANFCMKCGKKIK